MESEFIYHVTTAKEWEEAQIKQSYLPKDYAKDGFIHCSIERQIEGVLERFYQGQTGLVKLKIEKAKVQRPVLFELRRPMKKIIIQSIVCVYLILISGPIHAQKINSNTLTTENYLDSVNIKKYKNKIDTKRIKIEINHIQGISSFYSKNLDGTMTSTGERFYNNKFTAACNLYKLNTIVRVTNLRNGKTVLVRINDRMHPNMLKKGRVIDLSQSAAKQLVFSSKGLVKVMVDAIGYSKKNPKLDD